MSSHNKRGTRAKAAERQFMGENATCPWCGYRINSRWNNRKTFESGSNDARRALRKGRAKIVSSDRHRSRGGTVSHDWVVCAHIYHTY